MAQNLNLKENKYRLSIKVLSIYQILGGVLGIVMFVKLCIYVSFTAFLLYALAILMFLFQCFSIFCGLKLLKNEKTGLRFSLINQFLQLINFSMFGYSYFYCAGFFISPTIDLINFTPILKIGTSSMSLYIRMRSELNEIGFNIVALILIIFIEKLAKKRLIISSPEI